MSKVVIFGTGQLAEVVTVYLQMHSDVEIFGYTVDAEFRGSRDVFLGKPVFDWETLEKDFSPEDGKLFGPISYRKLNQFRKNRFLDGKRRGYRFLTFVHPASHVYTNQIGENCLILEQNVLQPKTVIGNNVILWSNNHIGHHTRLGDHCFVTSQVGIAGNCTIGEACFFAGKSGVIDNLTIGSGCLIGAGTVVTTSLADGDFALSKTTRIASGAARRFSKLLLG